MSFIDRAINAATDVAKSSAANYQRAQRRRAIQERIAAEQQTIMQACSRIGRLSLQAQRPDTPLPESARPAAEAIRRWESEIADLHRQVGELDARVAAMRAAPPPQ